RTYLNARDVQLPRLERGPDGPAEIDLVRLCWRGAYASPVLVVQPQERLVREFGSRRVEADGERDVLAFPKPRAHRGVDDPDDPLVFGLGCGPEFLQVGGRPLGNLVERPAEARERAALLDRRQTRLPSRLRDPRDRDRLLLIAHDLRCLA